jgi:hypothetical protein
VPWICAVPEALVKFLRGVESEASRRRGPVASRPRLSPGVPFVDGWAHGRERYTRCQERFQATSDATRAQCCGSVEDWLLSVCLTREIQHQDQQELADDGGPEQHATPVHPDETRLT